MFTSKTFLALLLGTAVTTPFVNGKVEDKDARGLRGPEGGKHKPPPPNDGPLQIKDEDIRSIDGSENEHGEAGALLLRMAHAEYDDGQGAMDPMDYNAREISNIVSANHDVPVMSADASDFLWVWGQFLDHDIDLSGEGQETFVIMPDDCDAEEDDICVINFHRSDFVERPVGRDGRLQREQTNLITR